MKRNGLDLPQAIPMHGNISFARKLFTGLARGAQHVGKRSGIKVTLIKSDAAILHHAGDNVGLGGARTNGAHAAKLICDGVNFLTHARGGKKRVAPAIHGRAARVRGLAVKSNGVALNTVRSKHRAKSEVFVEQNRSLLNVKLHVCGGIFKFAVTFFHALKINADIFQRRGKCDSIFVCEHARLIHVKRTSARGRTKQTFSKARAFFIGPINKANSDGRLAVELRVDAPKNFQTRKHIETAVKPAAVGN